MSSNLPSHLATNTLSHSPPAPLISPPPHTHTHVLYSVFEAGFPLRPFCIYSLLQKHFAVDHPVAQPKMPPLQRVLLQPTSGSQCPSLSITPAVCFFLSVYLSHYYQSPSTKMYTPQEQKPHLCPMPRRVHTVALNRYH